jgi:hypothetical protein
MSMVASLDGLWLPVWLRLTGAGNGVQPIPHGYWRLKTISTVSLMLQIVLFR